MAADSGAEREGGGGGGGGGAEVEGELNQIIQVFRVFGKYQGDLICIVKSPWKIYKCSDRSFESLVF